MERSDPPTRSKYFTNEVIAELRANPGVWYLIHEFATHGGRTSWGLSQPPGDIEIKWSYHNYGSQLRARANGKKGD